MCSNVCFSLPSVVLIILQATTLNDPYKREVSAAFLYLLLPNSRIISTSFFLFLPPLVFSTLFLSPGMLTDGSFTTNQPTQTHPFPQNIVSTLGSMEKVIFKSSYTERGIYLFPDREQDFRPVLIELITNSKYMGVYSKSIYGCFSVCPKGQISLFILNLIKIL